MDIFDQSIKAHEDLGGKLAITSKIPINDRSDLSIAYTPGVAGPCLEIAKNPDRVYDLTIKKNTVAIVSDGSAVLGLGNIGPEAAIPVMEGKAILLKEYADIDAFPICLTTQNTHEIIETVRRIAPVFGGINLEDISAPRCFQIERELQDLGIPVFHDDQHGTAITLLGALLNSAKLVGKPLSDMKVVINGAGAAGTAIAEILLGIGHDSGHTHCVKEILVCDTKGIISKKTVSIEDNPEKFKLAALTNKNHVNGTLSDALVGADVFIGVSVANVLTQDMIRKMGDKPIIFALANPIPEIMPDAAKEAGAFIVGTGRSDFNNQVNNVLIFPGIFRGAIDARSKRITPRMKLEAAYALAACVETPDVDYILPSVLDKTVAYKIAKAVEHVAREEELVL